MLRHGRHAASTAPDPETTTPRADRPVLHARPGSPGAGNATDEGPNPLESEPAILTVDELAALLRVERKTVYAAITRGDIPGVRRVGRSIRISRDAVLDWLRTAHVRAPHPRRIR